MAYMTGKQNLVDATGAVLFHKYFDEHDSSDYGILNEKGEFTRFIDETFKQNPEWEDQVQEEIPGQVPKVSDNLTEAASLTYDSNTALTTTLVTSWIEQKMRPELISEKIIKKIDLNLGQQGARQIKIPVNVLHTAGQVGDSGNISVTSQDYTSTTITPQYYYGYSRTTNELLDSANADVIADQIGLMGEALGRKLDEVVLAALNTATPTGDANNNYKALGSGQNLTLPKIAENIADMSTDNTNDLYGEADKMVVNTQTWNQIAYGDNDFKTAVQYASNDYANMLPYKKGVGILDCDVLVSPLVDANTTYLIDSDKCGYLVMGKEMQVLDNPTPTGYLAHDVVAYLAAASTVVQTASAYRIKDNTA